MKICTLDSRILAYFPKGLTHDFGQKTALFAFSAFGQKSSWNNVWGSFRQKESFLAFKNVHFR